MILLIANMFGNVFVFTPNESIIARALNAREPFPGAPIEERGGINDKLQSFWFNMGGNLW